MSLGLDIQKISHKSTSLQDYAEFLFYKVSNNPLIMTPLAPTPTHPFAMSFRIQPCSLLYEAVLIQYELVYTMYAVCFIYFS